MLAGRLDFLATNDTTESLPARPRPISRHGASAVRWGLTRARTRPSNIAAARFFWQKARPPRETVAPRECLLDIAAVGMNAPRHLAPLCLPRKAARMKCSPGMGRATRYLGSLCLPSVVPPWMRRKRRRSAANAGRGPSPPFAPIQRAHERRASGRTTSGRQHRFAMSAARPIEKIRSEARGGPAETTHRLRQSVGELPDHTLVRPQRAGRVRNRARGNRSGISPPPVRREARNP